MSWKGLIYVGVTVVFFLIFAAIVLHTYSKNRKKEGESAKYRMMDDD